MSQNKERTAGSAGLLRDPLHGGRPDSRSRGSSRPKVSIVKLTANALCYVKAAVVEPVYNHHGVPQVLIIRTAYGRAYQVRMTDAQAAKMPCLVPLPTEAPLFGAQAMAALSEKLATGLVLSLTQ